jgi:hypothetical protein
MAEIHGGVGKLKVRWSKDHIGWLKRHRECFYDIRVGESHMSQIVDLSGSASTTPHLRKHARHNTRTPQNTAVIPLHLQQVDLVCRKSFSYMCLIWPLIIPLEVAINTGTSATLVDISHLRNNDSIRFLNCQVLHHEGGIGISYAVVNSS